MTQYRNIHAVILAGGSGTRFWPLSRETYPKQMLQIVGEDTLLRQTIKRINGFVPPENIWIVTTEDKAQDIRFHLEPFGLFSQKIQIYQRASGKKHSSSHWSECHLFKSSVPRFHHDCDAL